MFFSLIMQYLCIVLFPSLSGSLCTTFSTNLAKFPCKFGTYIINFILFAHNIPFCHSISEYDFQVSGSNLVYLLQNLFFTFF